MYLFKVFFKILYMDCEINPRNISTTKFYKLIKTQNEDLPKKQKKNDDELFELVVDIEKGIYNKTIKHAESKNITKTWDNNMTSSMDDVIRDMAIKI